jgi:hypothetical protein
MTCSSIWSKLASVFPSTGAARADASAAEPLESRTLFAVAFQPIAYYTVSKRPEWVAVADLNNDGRPDMVTTSLVKDRISLLINQPDGSFVNTENLQFANPRSVAAADLDGDGNQDLIFSTTRQGEDRAGGVSVLRGNGDGTFQPRERYQLDNASRAIVAADVNGDARPDVVIASNEKIAVLLNNGDGTLARNVKYKGFESRISEVVVADVNNDAAPDLIAATPRRSGVSILLNNAAAPGTFAEPPVVVFAGRDAIAVQAGDFNGDGNVDLAVANSGFRVSGLNVLIGRGDATFDPRNPYATKNFSETVQVADFTGDGILDVMVGSAVGPYQFFTGDGTANFTGTDELVGGGSRERGVDRTVSADFNLDGKVDLASIVYRRSRVAVRLSV